ncbi:MAG: glycosyltransferase family 4 protein [Muribaculaceae bacterium]|nr:glycosyltransferase family 4 protein [Muribaculaceae bacterium]
MKPKIIRSATVGTSLATFCRGLLRELSDDYDVLAVSSPDDDLKRLGEADGVRTIGVPMDRHISPLRDLRSLWRMWRVLRKERPTMLHTMTPKAGLIGMMAAWLARVPVRVHTFTGLVWPTATGLKRRILMATDWLTCACATHVVPEGEGVKRDLQHITSKPMRVLGYGNVRGIDLNYYTPERKEPTHPGVTTFLFVGRLVGDKGINELVQAFVRLHATHPATRLVLVGRQEPQLDPLQPATLQAIDECDGIEAVGEQADVRPFYNDADVFVLSSYREGFPNVVIEAGAMGLPSIVTDINGANEIIINGRNGIIVPPRDEQALHDGMLYALEHPDEFRQMAAQARQSMAERYEQGYVRQCLKDFYREILAAK